VTALGAAGASGAAGAAAGFTIGARPGGGTRVDIILPYRSESAAAPAVELPAVELPAASPVSTERAMAEQRS
jgi:hypothetical protein